MKGLNPHAKQFQLSQPNVNDKTSRQYMNASAVEFCPLPNTHSAETHIIDANQSEPCRDEKCMKKHAKQFQLSRPDVNDKTSRQYMNASAVEFCPLPNTHSAETHIIDANQSVPCRDEKCTKISSSNLNITAKSFQPNKDAKDSKMYPITYLGSHNALQKDDFEGNLGQIKLPSISTKNISGLHITAKCFQPQVAVPPKYEKHVDNEFSHDGYYDFKSSQYSNTFYPTNQEVFISPNMPSFYYPTHDYHANMIQSHPELNEIWDFSDFQNTKIKTTPSNEKHVPCRFFQKGSCKKGSTCPFLHTIKTVCAPSVMSDNPDNTIIYPGVKCHFGPGVEVQKLILGEGDTNKQCSVSVSGLSMEITNIDITRSLSPFGTVLSIVRKHHSYAFVKFQETSSAAKAIEMLSGSSKKEWLMSSRGKCNSHRVKIAQKEDRISLDYTVAPGTIVLQETTVKIQWYAPSRAARAYFHDIDTAKKSAIICDKKVLNGRKVTVKFEHPRRNQKTSFSIWIGGLGACLTNETIKEFVSRFSGNCPYCVMFEKMPFKDKEGEYIIQKTLESYGSLLLFQTAKPNDSIKRKALAKFQNGEDASRACSELNGKKQKELGGNVIFINQLFSAKVTLHNAIYHSIKDEIDETLNNLYKSKCIRYKMYYNSSTVSVLLQADTPKDISRAKATISPKLKGTCLTRKNLPLWNEYFATAKAEFHLTNLIASIQSNVHAIYDKRRHEIRLFGPKDARDVLGNKILSLWDKIENEVQVIHLTPEQFSYCLCGGTNIMDKITTASNVDSISLDLKSKSLSVKSDNTIAAKTIVKLIMKYMSVNDDGDQLEQQRNICPICFCVAGDDDNNNNVITLTCQHTYCHDCFHAWMGMGQQRHTCFPLTCLSDGCCKSLHLEQLRDLLAPDTFLSILRNSVDDHVNKSSTLKFCPSPDCHGIYKCEEGQRVADCPTCLSSICTKCHIEEHFGLTCHQHQIAALPHDKLRDRVVEEILTLKCPRCQIAFFDFDGCFAIKCNNCPCNFCGWCLMDCNSDAHPHVKMCPSKPKEADSYFGSRKQFEEAHRMRQKGELMRFLSTLPTEDSKALMLSLRTDLKDHGFNF